MALFNSHLNFWKFKIDSQGPVQTESIFHFSISKATAKIQCSNHLTLILLFPLIKSFTGLSSYITFPKTISNMLQAFI